MDGAAIRQSVSNIRYLYDGQDISDLQDLGQLLDFYEKRQALRRDIAYAEQNMRALVNEDRVAIASLDSVLGARVDNNSALIETETKVRAAVGEVTGHTDCCARDQSDQPGRRHQRQCERADSAGCSSRHWRKWTQLAIFSDHSASKRHIGHAEQYVSQRRRDHWPDNPRHQL